MKGWIAAGIVVALIAAFALGTYAGYVYRDRSAAKSELADTHAALTATQKNLTDYQTRLQQAAAQFETDAAALHGIAEAYTDDQANIATLYRTLDTKSHAFWLAHPDIAACDIGPVGLGLWNAANRGDLAEPGDGGTGTGAAVDRPWLIGAVSAAAARAERQAAGPGSQPPAGHAAVPRLPRGQVAPDRSGEENRGAGRSASPASARSGRSRAALILDTGDEW